MPTIAFNIHVKWHFKKKKTATTRICFVLLHVQYLTLLQVYGGIYPQDKHWYRCRVKELVEDDKVHVHISSLFMSDATFFLIFLLL